MCISPADLKRALEEASLGQHFRVFRKQEVDLQLFLTMNDKDLAEMGILDSSDRAQLLALISKLVGQQKGAGNGSSRGVARSGREGGREGEREGGREGGRVERREGGSMCVHTTYLE